MVKPLGQGIGSLVSLHSVYDSLAPAHSPSRAIAGDLALGMVNSYGETASIATMLASGYTVAVTATEGLETKLFDGPTYGRLALDGIRAVLAEPATELRPDAPVGVIGYSGGSIAFVWAAQLAPSYAPDVSGQLVAAATGGIPVDIVNTLNYIDGAPFWGPMTVMILIGMSRAYGFSLDPYLSDYGKRMIHDLDKASIPEVNPRACRRLEQC